MEKRTVKNLFILTASSLVLICFSFILAENAGAGSEHNVSGWAWSENIGWVSFNNTSGGGTTNYGVNINPSTGVLSGYAWSEHIGWISFNESELGGCPISPCRATVNLSCPSDRCPISGWAKALAGGTSGSGGWDGWIRLRDSLYNPYIDPSTKEFRHYGWGGNETDGDWQKKAVVGWVSFNCAEGGATGGNICATKSNYKVITSLAINQRPEARNLSTSEGDYCCAPYPPIYLSWQFFDPNPGDTQSAYRVEIATDSGYTNIIHRSCGSDPNCKNLSGSNTYAPPNLGFTTTYYWRVKVWDSQGAESDWANGPNFTTRRHYPCCEFTWSPPRPAVEQEVQFIDQSQAFDGASITSWSWTFENGQPGSSTGKNPKVIFTALGSGNQNRVFLTVTDSYGLSCSQTKYIGLRLPLPKWKEIKPF